MFYDAFLPGLVTFSKFFLTHVIALASISLYACDQPVIIVPGQHEDVVSAKPVVSWLPVNGATGYEVSMQSRIPEGEVVVQFKTTTADTKFISQTALSRDRAIVSAKVKTRCGADSVSAESERIFFVDVRGTCPLPSRLTSVPMGQLVKISWESNPQFDEVEVRSFGSASMGPLERVARTQSFAVIPNSVDATSLVGVRGICKEANGDWAWVLPAKS